MESIEELKAQLTALRLKCFRLREKNERLKSALHMKESNENENGVGVPAKNQKLQCNRQKRKELLYPNILS